MQNAAAKPIPFFSTIFLGLVLAHPASAIAEDSIAYGPYWGLAPHCDEKDKGYRNFRPPKWGFCNESEQCQITTFKEPLTYCTGSFATLEDIRIDSLAQAKKADEELQKKIVVLQENVRRLSDANDALTKRITDLQAEIRKK